ncbi:MAG: hypothetical protein ACK5H0_01430, partial [Bacteroidota bacterium]
MLRVLTRQYPGWCRIITAVLMILEISVLGVDLEAAQKARRSKATVKQATKHVKRTARRRRVRRSRP